VRIAQCDGMLTGGLKGSVVQLRTGKQLFLLHIVYTGPGGHLATYSLSTQGLKRPEREADDHSPPSSVEVRETWVNVLNSLSAETTSL
jgi:hypothetical protein